MEWVRANQSDSIDTNSIYSGHDGSDDAESTALTEAASCVLSAVRLPLMSLSDLLTVVRPTNLIPPDTILDAIAARNQGRDTELRYRGCLSKCITGICQNSLYKIPFLIITFYLVSDIVNILSVVPEENLAHPSHGTQVLQGEMRSALLDGDSKNYDMERGYTRHAINEDGDQGILIKLGTEAILNHFKMLLWDKDPRYFKFDIMLDCNFQLVKCCNFYAIIEFQVLSVLH